jgi:membrane protein
VNSEVIRMRQLLAGVEADETIRLPRRDVARNATLARWREEDVATAARIRTAAARLPDEATPQREHLRAVAADAGADAERAGTDAMQHGADARRSGRARADESR